VPREIHNSPDPRKAGFRRRLQKFVWPRASEGAVRLSAAQWAMLVEGLDWRHAIVHEEVATPTLA
jgi:transposase